MEKDGPKLSIFGPTLPPAPPLFTPEDSRGQKKYASV